jgi:formate dehydrogenase
MSRTIIPIRAEAPTRQRRREAKKGRTVDPVAQEQVRETIGPDPLVRDHLIEYLHLLQDKYGHLSDRHLAALAQEIRMAQAEVFEVASFYHHFDLVKDGATVPPAITVRVCDGLPCEMAGAKDLLERLPTLLGGGVRVVAAPCSGRCSQAPVVTVGRRPIGPATVSEVERAVSTGSTDDPIGDFIGLAQYVAEGGYRVLRECTSGRRSPDDVIRELESSGLRGMGGAGFPAGKKWGLVRAEPAPRLMAVNIDEGEPGTFKDRVYLESDPHRFLEGVLIAAWAVGIAKIYIYLRDEYHACRTMLLSELDALRANPPCPAMPEIELRRGAGAYICGEESAMIESIEGKRGLPRLRPPYVAQVGLFGRPTLEHNFETLNWVRDIIEKGSSWFASYGRHGRSGLRSYSVSGRVRRPGVKLAPAGITIRELIEEYCGGMLEGHRFYAYLPGGASGGILPAHLDDVPLDFDTLQPYGCFIGSAAVIVLSDQDRVVDAARNVMRFFAQESCGQCTPCRNGTGVALNALEASVWDKPLLEELSAVMRDASICGLGQAAPNAFDCVMKYFPHEVS